MYNHEAALLSCLIRDNTYLDDVITLDSSDFNNKFYKDVFLSIKELISKSISADVITLGDYLKDKYGSGVYNDIYSLHETACALENTKWYAALIEKNGIKKKLQRACDQINSSMTGNNAVDEEDILDKALNLINSIADKKNMDIRNADHLLDSFMEVLGKRMEATDGLIGIPTGFKEIDQLTHGFQPGQLIILAARPGMGKTTLAVNFATHEVYTNNGSVAFFSLEMPDISIIERIIASQANIYADNLKTGRLKAEDYDVMAEQMKKMQGKNLFLMDCENPSEINSYCRQIKRKHGLSLIVIDYLGLLLHGKHEHAHLVLGEITRTIKKLAIKLQVPIVLLCQMNRAVESRPNKRPLLSDLRQSGSIEQDADIVMFISQSDDPSSPTQGYALLNIAKHRNGEIADIVLKFDGKFNRFSESDMTAQEYLRNSEDKKTTQHKGFTYQKSA